MYFENTLDANQFTAVGYTSVANYGAGAISLTASPDWAKLAYSTFLTAKSTNTPVAVHLIGTQNGFAKIVRVWLDLGP